VCLGILQNDEKVKLEEKKIVEKFLNETGFRPSDTRIFAGALPYSQYNFFIRFIMKRIAGKAGGDTDTSKDYEYTDWKEVSRFVETLQAQRAAGPGPRVVARCPVVEKQ
jgi:menaquinone-dependent protoporphyrinogen oxidase